MALKWFKFYPQTWMSGRIMLESYTVKGVFIDCCNLLFTRECDVDEEMLREYIRNDKAIDRLFKRGFMRVENDQVVIDWICEEVEGAVNRTKLAQKKHTSDGTAMLRQCNSKATAMLKEKKRKKQNRSLINQQRKRLLITLWKMVNLYLVHLSFIFTMTPKVG